MTCSPMYTFLKPWKKPSMAMSSRCRLCSPYRCACAPVSTTCSRPKTRAARSPSIVSCAFQSMLIYANGIGTLDGS